MPRHPIRRSLLAACAAAVLPLAGCDVDVKDPGALPDVDVTPGEAPDVDVRGPDVDVNSKEKTVTVPDIDVNAEEKTITVPDVDINAPAENENETPSSGE